MVGIFDFIESTRFFSKPHKKVIKLNLNMSSFLTRWFETVSVLLLIFVSLSKGNEVRIVFGVPCLQVIAVIMAMLINIFLFPLRKNYPYLSSV